jgi:hypothetical protein
MAKWLSDSKAKVVKKSLMNLDHPKIRFVVFAENRPPDTCGSVKEPVANQS